MFPYHLILIYPEHQTLHHKNTGSLFLCAFYSIDYFSNLMYSLKAFPHLRFQMMSYFPHIQLFEFHHHHEILTQNLLNRYYFALQTFLFLHLHFPQNQVSQAIWVLHNCTNLFRASKYDLYAKLINVHLSSQTLELLISLKVSCFYFFSSF